jgi:DNA repair exonuclease SbcCD ATPase subunit
MSSGDKRNIVDRLFGFTLINQMKDSIKNERKEIRDKMKTLTDELSIIEESITSINQKIKNLEESKKEDKTKLIHEYKEKILELIESKKKTNEDLDKIKDLESKMSKTLKDKHTEFSNLSYDIKTIKSKIDLYDNSQCPTCGSNLDTDHHHETKGILQVSLKENKEKYDSIESLLKDNQNKLKTISDKIKEFEGSVIRINMTINQYKREVEKAINESKELDSEYLSQLVTENLDKKEDKRKKHIDIGFEDTFLETVEAVLGDDGVKNLAMKTILPTLNQNISNMSKQMHLPYSIKFNDKFDCIINALGEEINPRSMSTGERKKADFIIIIALLKILKIRYPSLNILFLDEIFSSVDSSGVYEIIKILKDVSKENFLNTWVINHTELPTELFDKRVEVYREGGFSKLLIENIT